MTFANPLYGQLRGDAEEFAPAKAAFQTWGTTPDAANARHYMTSAVGMDREGSLWGAFHAGWTAHAQAAIVTFEVDTAAVRELVECIASPGVAMVLAERARQVREEQFSAEHDDRYIEGELGLAAACYIAHPRIASDSRLAFVQGVLIPELWPWDRQWWKPGGKTLADYERRLVKGLALGIAELERLQRLDRVAAERVEGKPDAAGAGF